MSNTPAHKTEVHKPRPLQTKPPSLCLRCATRWCACRCPFTYSQTPQPPLQNFYDEAFRAPVTHVTIGTAECSNVVVSRTNFTSLECLAPPGPGFGDVQVTVSVEGGGSGGQQFRCVSPPSAIVEQHSVPCGPLHLHTSCCAADGCALCISRAMLCRSIHGSCVGYSNPVLAIVLSPTHSLALHAHTSQGLPATSACMQLLWHLFAAMHRSALLCPCVVFAPMGQV